MSSTNDFVIGATKVKGFVNVAGIQSPGLTAAPAIADSLPTVKWHTGNLYGKLGVNSRTQAVAKARELSLLTP